ncbi:MAG: arylsulfatase [Marinilabiliaceae bacterium]|nr:arylsulfatase [Marinilabiliaceae bacterium]
MEIKEFKRINKLKYLGLVSLMGLNAGCTITKEKQKPNVVIIYMDDLGIGDVSCYGMGQLKTPGIDRIAAEGLRFENGYATAATCTPSRYSILTGDYPWRNDKAAVLAGDAKLLIDTSKVTLPKILQKSGYKTAAIGKWHLGLGQGNIDWNKEILAGPKQVGFDYSYIMAATNDRTPTVFVKNGLVEGLEANDPLEVNYRKNYPGEPTGKLNPELLKMKTTYHHHQSINNGISRIGFMKGGKNAMWVDENMADTFLVESLRFIEENKTKPFFLYYALHQPHVPRVPHPRFAGKSGMGPRGDAILEGDWCVAQVINKLESLHILENTLVIFSSDNGPVLDDGYADQAVEKLGGHTPWGVFRGGKYSLFDAGAHVPFIVMWKGKIKQGVSKAMISQVDIMASAAKLIGSDMPDTDSEQLLSTLMGKTEEGRDILHFEGLKGRVAVRSKEWVLIPPYKGPLRHSWGGNVESGLSKDYQLYHMTEDPNQQHNVYTDFPEIANELLIKLNEGRNK